MTQNTIARTTEVISISLTPPFVERLENAREKYGLSRSSYIAMLIKRSTEDERWEKIYTLGKKTAKKFRITSEEDIDSILHEA